MAETRRVLAFDFGASSGRAMIKYDGEKITLKEVHRFPTIPSLLETQCTGTHFDYFMRSNRE